MNTKPVKTSGNRAMLLNKTVSLLTLVLILAQAVLVLAAFYSHLKT